MSGPSAVASVVVFDVIRLAGLVLRRLVRRSNKEGNAANTSPYQYFLSAYYMLCKRNATPKPLTILRSSRQGISFWRPNWNWRTKNGRYIVLSREFFNEIMSHPIPTDMKAAKALSCSPVALDLLMWLSYRSVTNKQLHSDVLRCPDEREVFKEVYLV